MSADRKMITDTYRDEVFFDDGDTFFLESNYTITRIK